MSEQQPEPGIKLNVPQDVIDRFAKLGVQPSTFSGGELGDPSNG
jgi:1,4-dihydroxy-2-naphthoyl-CoA hydrolase